MTIKKFFLSLMMMLIAVCFAQAQQANDYSSNWKKADQFEKKGLTKSALNEVLKIYDLATKEHNDVQQIKACIYELKYRDMIGDESKEDNFFFVDTLISKAKAPAKNVLLSIQAELLWKYLQDHRWQLYDRTTVVEEKNADISTWSIDKINNTIAGLYKASLTNETILKNTNISSYDAILNKGENTRQLRPTLYDLLAERALNFFTNDERDVTKAAYSFTIDDDRFFSPANEFVNTEFITKDTSSLYFKAILLLQNLLKFHLKDTSPSALIDADIMRINFVKDHAVMENKEKLYEDALMKIETNFPDDSVTAQASYLRAKLHFDRGQNYDPLGKTADQFEIKRAEDLCKAIIKRSPKSEGGINAKNLLAQIVAPSLSIETEKVNIPGQPFRSLVSYKNVDTLYLRVIKTSREEIKKLDPNNESYWRALTTLMPTKEWSVTLPDLQDHQTHSIEIKIDAFPSGTYFILASKDAAFPISKNELSKQLIYVSNISYIHNDSNYYVLNRDNGQPLSNVKVQVWNEKYNYSASKYEDTKAEQYLTNGNGYFKLKKYKEDARNVLLQFITKDDELFLDDANILNSNTQGNNEDTPKPTTFLFTDRSIYRPGQTVYFKGIVIKSRNKKNENSVLPNFKTTILLLDANDQKVASQTLTTNEFGSYHGTFILPQNLLNGNFSISDFVTESNSNFNVEEYKRPNFFVEIEKPKGTYRLFDSITVTGNAKAYTGNNIDGALVKYRVVRKVIYPMFDRYNSYDNIRNDNNEMEISNGEATTNAKGEFNVTFKAIPDLDIDKKEQPVFYYEVSADVTDINGETRSGSTSVAVAYQSLQLNIDVADQMPVDSFKNIIVKSTDLNDQQEKTFVTLTIQQLRSPDKIFRERYWKQPDQFLMSKDEYYRYFPYDIYKNENEVSNFETKETVYERSDSSDISWAFTNTWKSGYYKITATTKDKYGEVVNAVKYIQLTQTNDKAYTPIEVTIDKPVAQPGDKVTYTIKTGFNKIWLINSLYKMDSSHSLNYINITSDKTFEQTISITQNDRGGSVLNNIFIQHDRVYSADLNIDIPWKNKELNISFNTFRNKLLPGAKETWSIKIIGNKNEKVAAELLTAMYDASLDQFYQQSWQTPDIWPTLSIANNWEHDGFEEIRSEKNYSHSYAMGSYSKAYDRLLNFENAIFQRGYFSNRVAMVYDKSNYKLALTDSLKTIGSSISTIKFTPPKVVKDEDISSFTNTVVGDKTNYVIEDKPGLSTKLLQQQLPIQIRKNFNETAFFFSDLKTDTAGNIEFNFTMPDAITQWKLMMLAHTKEMATAYAEKTVVTQKPLMIQADAPRFLREGDKMEFSAKIVNLSDSALTGDAQLELLDAATDQPVNILFKNNLPSQTFSVQAGQSVAIKFPINIPLNFNSALTYRIVAKANDFSDGEEMILPVLTNRTLVTESMPLNIRNANKKEFRFEKLLNSDNSKTLSNHSLTVEFTSNPAWYAVQALPYLMEYPYECAEQTFDRYYANTLATYISNSTPKIKTVFDKWKSIDTAALQSNLEKNEELKSALLQETPWVLDAQNEQQQKKNIALLFDMARMSAEQEKALDKLKDMQSSNGGFTWFKGGPDDRYITQYIITGIGHLRKLNALNKDEKIKDILENAIPYLDKKIKEDYDNLIRYKNNLKTNILGYAQIQYLYMRSFFPEYKIPVASQSAYNYYRSQAQKYWMNNDKYMQAMIALALYRTNDNVTSKAIINSLKENAINKDEMGMYWKEWETGGYYWYQAPIESQALMIEAFTDIDKNTSTINNLKTWLLKQKQTQNWKTTKATAEACYALLLNGSNWLAEEKNVQVRIGDTVINSNEQTDDAGTGYFKKTIEGEKVKPSMGNIEVAINSKSYSQVPLQRDLGGWGSVYWQYFEDLDKITPSATPLKLSKKLFIEKNSDKGHVLVAVDDTTILQVGDKIKVRIELKVNRDMEYIHMKDMRAACMEPVNVLSEYKWQDGLGYYESTKDASTNFFFNQLPKGSYVFEYPLFVTHSGNFSNGITTIQCMYAPEFSAHSEGVRVTVN